MKNDGEGGENKGKEREREGGERKIMMIIIIEKASAIKKLIKRSKGRNMKR